jgi:NTP pyrophosphatase (non-canonical NTP hydrolase)
MAMAYRGLVKLSEECGELVQIIAKKIAYCLTDEHPDGKGSMQERLQDEMADVYAALDFVAKRNNFDIEAMQKRHKAKLALFQQWDYQNEE